MEAYEAYQKFVAIKLHFTSENYDYFKYQGKLKSTTPSNFEVRKDKYFFHKLSKHKDLELFLASIFFNKKKVWVGELFSNENEDLYINALKRIQSLEYTIRTDLSRYASYDDALNVQNGSYPKLLLDHRRGDVSPETLVILNDLYGVFNYWSEKIDDPIVWPSVRSDLEKYGRFLTYDKKKFADVLNEIKNQF